MMVNDYREFLVSKIKMANYERGVSTAQYDTILYNPHTNTFESLEQKRKIEKLESELKKKEVEREKSLQSIIAYFYKRK